MTDANFSQAVLLGVDFAESNISPQQLVAALDVRQVDLRGLDFNGGDLGGIDFTGANFSGTNLFATNLKNTVLVSTDLSFADLALTNVTAAQLRSASSVHAVDLSGNDLSDFNLDGLQLDLANFTGANLAEASFHAASLAGANFTSASITRTNFTDADLRGAILATANLGLADFTGANLDGAVLGDGTTADGFIFDGNLTIGTASTTVNSLGSASLGVTTTIAGGVLHVANGLRLDAGRTLSGFGSVDTPNDPDRAVVLDGRVEASGAGLVFSGYVKGAGSLFGQVTFTGTHSPGPGSPCVVVENIDLTASSTLVLEIGGTVSGSEYDQIKITGSASLDGTLRVSLIDGFQPAAGDMFRLFSGNTHGDFTNLLLPALAGGLNWNTSDLAVNGALYVVPEPGGLALCGLGAPVCWLRAKRRTRV